MTDLQGYPPIPVGMTYRCRICGAAHLTGFTCPVELSARRDVLARAYRATQENADG